MTSKRTKWKNNAIFEFLDPKNLCLDIHHATKVTLNFLFLLEVRGQKMTSGRSICQKTMSIHYIESYQLVQNQNKLFLLKNPEKMAKYHQKWPLGGHFEVITEVNDLRFENFQNLRVGHVWRRRHTNFKVPISIRGFSDPFLRQDSYFAPPP